MNRALIVKKKWLDMILSGEKVWEIRGQDTSIRGKIGLIESGSGLIVGECRLMRSFNNVNENDKRLKWLHGIDNWEETVRYKKPHIWLLTGPVRYEKPIPYNHPRGAVIWVKIDGLKGDE